ncbi:MAG: acyl-CoA thioesterase [Aquabacterium sp.]|uniref:acyl-CoA thioesterase n=1 Tax=Aquabacterium sp. TaxID=1872578 RepID=UPI003BCB93A3
MSDAVPQVAWDLPHPHVERVVVTSEHIDVMNHTNNVVYLRWLELIAWQHSMSLGIGPEAFTQSGQGMVVRSHHLDYLQATHLGDEVLLATWVVHVDKLFLTRKYQFVRAANGQTVFRGESHFVSVDIESGKPKRMPQHFLDAYSGAKVSA